MKIEITTPAPSLRVVAPYNVTFVNQARLIGGKWVPPAWVFDIRDESRVRDLCREVYGSDGVTADLVTIRVTCRQSIFAPRGPITIAGRPIVRAFGRDSGAYLADGVVFISGEISSGGSVKNWGAAATEGSVFLVRDFPRAVAEGLFANGHTKMVVQIEQEEPVIDRHALEAERIRVSARLAKIEDLLVT